MYMYMYLTKKQLQSTILAKWTYKHFDFHYSTILLTLLAIVQERDTQHELR